MDMTSAEATADAVVRVSPPHRASVEHGISSDKAGMLTGHLSKKWANREDGALNTRKSLVTLQQANHVRSKLTKEENGEVDQKMLNQFLRATKQDADKAAKRLKDTVAWRRKEHPHEKICKKCITTSRAHYLHVIGFTKLDQPIIYSCLAMAKDRDIMANREHMLVTFEQAIRAMPPHVEQWIWLCDFHGFGIRDCDPRLAKMFLDISEKHYPERLAEFFVISAPSMFNMLWNAIQPWVDPYTREKIRFLQFEGKKDSKRNEPLKKEMARILEPDVQEWLLEELVQNRQKIFVKEKEYPYGKLDKPGDTKRVIMDGHDARGHCDWVKAVVDNPSILMPNNVL